MTEQEKKTKVDRAAERMKRAQAEYKKAVREEKEKERKAQDRHKYMMGGCVQKYFPKGLNVFDFNELEMNRIIACAFSLKDVQNMINTVINERPLSEATLNLAKMEVLSHNKKNLERMLQNERSERSKTIKRDRNNTI